MKPRGFTVFFRNAALVAILVFAAQASFPAFVDGFLLSDTVQTKCYNNGNEIACPRQEQPFYGQDGSYKGPPQAFKNNGDGTVNDLNTGLMWEQGDLQNSRSRNWRAAVDYCEALTLAGYSDWRLPSYSELRLLLDLRRYNPSIDTAYFPGCKKDRYYWSGTSYAGYTPFAWFVYFFDGYTERSRKSYTYYVRCVRGESLRLSSFMGHVDGM